MTNAELAILSLIAEQPRHGYEIEQILEERGMRDWTEVGFSSIYFLLRKLAGKGWVESRTEKSAGRGPGRRVFSITSTGRQAWQEATLNVLGIPQRGRLPILLGLANLPGLPQGEALAALRSYHDRLLERRAMLEARRSDLHPLHVSAMFDLSLALVQAELNWLAGFIASYAGGPPADPE